VSARMNEHGQPVGEPVPGWVPRRRPEPGPFEGRHGAVVPLRTEHARELFGSCSTPGTEPLWTYLAGLAGPFPDVASFEAALAALVADPGSVSVAITTPGGGAGGLASYMRIDPANGSVEVGGILLGTTLRRTTAATEAMYLMARHVFEDLGYRRYEWKCDALNTPSREAAVRLGFRYEGTHRSAVVYKGRSRDTAWFSITDEEWPALADGYDAWLAPDNFDDSGRQRRSLAEIRGERGSHPPGRPDAGTAVPHSGTRERMA
jgi:RimJ/RimL family protein N-acetyltransferase